MASRADFLEIEHKFIVGDGFDAGAFCAAALALGPTHTTALHVEDTYFVTDLDRGLIFRHRFDAERQELTLKSRGADDVEVRTEINLRLDQATGNQRAAVEAFLGPFRIVWRGTIGKDIRVFYYPDCEAVYYRASSGGRTIDCVEFEATGGADLDASRAVLDSYEARLGFAGKPRVRESLFELLLLPQMPAALQADSAGRDLSTA